MSDVLAPEALSRIDAFYDATLKPRLDALDDRRRQVRWLIIKAFIVVLIPVPVLIAGDLLDGLLPSGWVVPVMALAWASLVGGLIFALVRYLLPGVAAYANYRSRFKRDIVAEIFGVICPTAQYDSLQGITQAVFDGPGLFNTRGAFECDDRVRGRIGQTAFEASEVRRAYSTGTGKHARSYQVFRGLFFHVDSGRRLRGVTVIDPEGAKPHQLGDRTGLGLVPVENPAFEQAFRVYASDEAEARSLLTPAMTSALVTLRQQAGKPVFVAFKERRAYLGVDYGRALFEPGIVQTTSKAAVREIAGHFAFVETIVRELNLHAGAPAAEVDESLLQAPGIEPHPLSQLAAAKAGTLTESDLWTLAAAEIDDSAKEAGGSVPRPQRTRIRLEREAASLSITYGLRLGFWVMLGVSVSGALLALSALRAEAAPAWAGPASVWSRSLPAVPLLDAFAADAPTPWLIVGTAVAVLFALVWTGYVRRVVIAPDHISIYRGFRPFPRVYRRPPYGRAIRIKASLYITKNEGLKLMNPTASPVLTEPEARWLTSEMKRALGQA